ncbi:hypothetical protein ACQEU8_16015 [Streptomyces sp. CA-250714]|uniref:hypothetical protein n=1 Tax=Streptomyces sp. CA-250714 TaxID=3240060 RepID=UPI003D8B1E27
MRVGYRGPLSLEVFHDVFRQADAGRTAVDAMRSLIGLEEVAGLATPPAPVVPPGSPSRSWPRPTPARCAGCSAPSGSPVLDGTR